MPIAPKLQQHQTQVVSLRDWLPDDEFPIGPQGAKPKRIFVCPNPPPHPFLIGGHRYLFKEPTGFRAQQIWSEVIAYELSKALYLPVPPAFLAVGPGNAPPGVLVEFFYGYVGEPERRFVHAIERLQARHFLFDHKRGSIKDNIDLCRIHKTPSWRSWWARTLAFDAVIGNTDRHSENWGFLLESRLQPVRDMNWHRPSIMARVSAALFERKISTNFCNRPPSRDWSRMANTMQAGLRVMPRARSTHIYIAATKTASQTLHASWTTPWT